MSDLPKLLICGLARHGKDEASDYLCKNYGFKAESSSHAAARIFIYDTLKSTFNYKSIDECFNDRHNHRELWYRLICLYNRTDKAALAKEIMKDNQIYCGMRDKDELNECLDTGVFDYAVWIDASDRVDYVEPSSSINIDYNMFKMHIKNNGTKEQFYVALDGLMEFLEVERVL